MQCKKCGLSVPTRIKINGKTHHLRNRKYCLACSPFGLHNTKKLERINCPQSVRICDQCNRPMGQVRGSKCWSCASRISREKHASDLYSLMGSCCWICGYNRSRYAMDYHHVKSEQKLFNLTMREMQYAWDRILSEAKKCALLCCRCHRECHEGLIDGSDILRVYEQRWLEIESGACSTTVSAKSS